MNNKITKYFCRSCGGIRNHEVLFAKNTTGSDDYLHWNDNYMIVECFGCETISFVNEYGDSEMYNRDDEGNDEYFVDTNIFPLYLEIGSEITEKYLLPPTIKTIYNETINAFKVKSYILTAGGFRAIIEAVCNHLKIKKTELSVRIDLLYEKGYLTINESKRLHAVRFLGNDSLHEMAVPKLDQLHVVLEVTNHLLHNIFIQDKVLRQRLDVLVDNYDDFLNLLEKCITEGNIGKTLSITELLGKSRRILKKGCLEDFEKQLSEEIRKGQHDFLKMTEPEETKNQKYFVTSHPNIRW